MKKVVDLMPYLEKEPVPKSAVYAVIAIPAEAPVPQKTRRTFFHTAANLIDMAVSLGLGAFLLIFVFLLMLSL